MTMGLVGGLITVFVVLGYLTSAAEPGGVEHGRAMALAVLTLSSAGLTVWLSGLRTLASRVVSGATLALSLVLIQLPPLARLLHLEPLHANDWGLAGAAALLACVPLAIGLRERR